MMIRSHKSSLSKLFIIYSLCCYQTIKFPKILIFNMYNRFRIHVLVKDGSGEAYLMLLDWIASGVVPESASHLLNGSLEEVITFFP